MKTIEIICLFMISCACLIYASTIKTKELIHEQEVDIAGPNDYGELDITSLGFSERLSRERLLDISKLIPTWPDYIELKKDLIIQDPNNYEFFSKWTILKGTKIYYK